MHLELKHIAPYLQYENLKYFNTLRKEVELLTIHSLSAYLTLFTRGVYKPILRPLSDLTKDIEHNGEVVSPLAVINKIGYENRLKTDFEFYSPKYQYHTIVSNLDVYFKLLEWHFDIFGLIEKGLAVDINTLNI